MDQGILNLRWARALFQGLVQNGVRQVVLSPGARSTPLALAGARTNHLQLWVHPDERSAAFFALGITRAARRPVALVATSGSAPSHWYPAVIEAAYDRQPLILLSADRPPELQGCGANQTIDQQRLFGVHVRHYIELPVAESSYDLAMVRDVAFRAVDAACWPMPGPVHLNVPFREPLVPADVSLEARLAPIEIEDRRSKPEIPRLEVSAAELERLRALFSGGRGVIVCGREDYRDGFSQVVTELAARLQAPILADPLSGLRFGPQDRSFLCTRYDAFLRNSDFCQHHRPDWVIRFGAVPTSKVVLSFLAQGPVDGSILVVPTGPWPDPLRHAQVVIHADPERLCRILLGGGRLGSAPESWIADFRAAERRAEQQLRQSGEAPLEAEIIEVLQRVLPAGSRLFCGSSMVIRDFDAFLTGGVQRIELHGNRGVSGIDGHVSTTLGLAAADEAPVVAVLGDLAFYHDMNGLLRARDIKATFVVFNNGGGAIFGYLPQSDLAEFERLWLTPPGIELDRVATLYSLRYQRVSEPEAFQRALADSLASERTALIEVVVDRQESWRRHQQYWTMVSDE